MTRMKIEGASPTFAFFLVIFPREGDLPDVMLKTMIDGWSNGRRTSLEGSMTCSVGKRDHGR